MKPIIGEWMNFAMSDLMAAEQLSGNRNLTTIACFHSQQCVEKCLKAIIELKGIIPPASGFADKGVEGFWLFLGLFLGEIFSTFLQIYFISLMAKLLFKNEMSILTLLIQTVND